MPQDAQRAVEQVLAIEREADAIVDRAAAEARALRVRSAEEVRRLRESLLEEARRRAETMLAEARAEAERERARRLAEADRQNAELERSARQRFDEAVGFVVARLMGEPTVETPAVQGSVGRSQG